MLLFDSLSSTNRWAMANLASCNHGDVVCAARQTEGVGRFSREWLVPEDRGLALSVVLKQVEAVNVGQVAALAIRECLNAFGIVAKLKWPNDVLVGGRKIAGILAERDSDTGALVLGIGLNVNITLADLSAVQLDKIATSMLLEKDASFEMGTVRAKIISSLESAMAVPMGSASFVERWAEYDCLAGSTVTVNNSNRVISGQYLGIDAEGRLRLKEETGEELALWSGDVEKLGVFPAERS